MPPVTREQLTSMLDTVPQEEHEQFLTHLKSKGYTLQGNSRPDAATPAGQKPIYPQQKEISKPQAAWQAMGAPVPGLDQAGKFVSETLPSKIVEKTSTSQSSVVRGAGIAAGGAIGSAGEMIPRTVGDVATQLAAEPVAKGLGKVGKAAWEAAKPAREVAAKFGTALLARDIGVAEPFIENMKKNPAALKDLSEDMGVVHDHAKSLGDIMKRGVDRLGAHIEAIENHFVETRLQNPDALGSVSLDATAQRLNSLTFRASIPDTGFRPLNMVSPHEPLSLSSSPLSKISAMEPSDVSIINKYKGLISKVQDKASALDLINLKQRLGKDIAWNKEEVVAKKIGTKTNQALMGVYKDLQAKLEGLSPEIKQANAEYAKARKQYEVLQRKVFGGSPEEAVQRVKLRIQRGVAPEALIERAAQINSQAEGAMRKLIDKVSAQQFTPYVRKGIAGGAMAAAGGAAATMATLGGHGVIPLIADLASVVLSSPRMAAMGIRGADAASTAISKGVAEAAGIAEAHPNVLRALGQGLAKRL